MLYKLFIYLISSFCLPFSSGTSCKDSHFRHKMYTDRLTVFSETKAFHDLQNTKCLTKIASFPVKLQKSFISIKLHNEGKMVHLNGGTITTISKSDQHCK